MSFFDWFFHKPIKIKKKTFQRNRAREHELGYSLVNRASDSLIAFGKLMVAVYLTMPVLSISTLFFESFILITANLIVALGHCGHFLYRLLNRQVSVIEAILTLGGIGLCIGLVIYFMPIVFAATMSVSSFLVGLNTIATALNIFFVVSAVLFPPLIKLTEQLIAKVFGYDLHKLYDHTKPLDKDNDRNAIECLLKGKLTEDNKAEFETYNRLVKKLSWYKEKYRGKVFGPFTHHDQIAALDTHIRKLTIDGDASGAIGFIKRKVSFKTTHDRKLEEASNDLKQAKEKGDIKEYNQKGLKFFENFRPLKSNKELEESYSLTRQLLFNARTRQAQRIKALQECLPLAYQG